MFDPSFKIAEAYVELRKEASVLMELQHPYIVSFYGASLSPIALILDVAPMGDLAGQLEIFRSENSLLPPPVVKDIIFQLASALSYLHEHSYVHRDLKPANVLVWSFPAPHRMMRDLPLKNTCLVRLSDYGMTQKEIGEQMLGRPGTPQYMAPEILQDEGREIFNNKIDIYSLGMIIYDCICLTPPWLSVSLFDFRTMVAENKRPMTTTAAKQSPMAFLELLCFCTLPNPKERPNALDLVDILQEQEMCKLIESIEIKTPPFFKVANMGLSLVSGDNSPQAMNTIALFTVNDVRADNKCKSSETSINETQAVEVTLLFYKDILRETTRMSLSFSEICDDGEALTCICCVYKTLWLGTDNGSLIVLQITDGKLEERARNFLERPVHDIYHIVHEGINGHFSCVAVVNEGGVINLYNHHWEINKDADRTDMTPIRIGTLEDTGFSNIYGLCFVTGRNDSDHFYKISTSSPVPDSPISPKSDPSKMLQIPHNLELWISGDKSQLKRFKVQKKTASLACKSDGMLLKFQPIYPALKHDDQNIFEGRLKVKKLLTLDSCRRVWSAGAKSKTDKKYYCSYCLFSYFLQ